MAGSARNPVLAGSRMGRVDAIEAWSDSISRGLMEADMPACGNGAPPAAEADRDPVSWPPGGPAATEERYDMLVEVVGEALPHWVRAEPMLPATARWHLLIVRDMGTLAGMRSRRRDLCVACWQVILVGCARDGSVDLKSLPPAHLVLRCAPEDLDHVAEDLAHFLLRHGYIGTDEADITACAGMETASKGRGQVFILPGRGLDAVPPSLVSHGSGDMISGVGCMMIAQFIAPGTQWSLRDVDDMHGALVAALSPERSLLKCFDNSPRTEVMIVLLHLDEAASDRSG